MIYLQLYLSFLQVGLFSVGGGYAAMPLIRSQVVELHPWMTLQEFTNLITIAEMTPGPIAVNCATFVGLRIAQLPGAVIATLGCITPALVLVSLLAWCYRRWRDLSVLQSVLACLRPAVVALILGAGLSILGIVVFPNGILGLGSIDWIGTGSFFAAFILLRKYKWNPILTMCLCGAAGLRVAFVGGNGRVIIKAIPHNSKCRYGERGAADAKPKAQIILDVLSSILATQMPCRSCRSGA